MGGRRRREPCSCDGRRVWSPTCCRATAGSRSAESAFMRTSRVRTRVRSPTEGLGGIRVGQPAGDRDVPPVQRLAACTSRESIRRRSGLPADRGAKAVDLQRAGDRRPRSGWRWSRSPESAARQAPRRSSRRRCIECPCEVRARSVAELGSGEGCPAHLGVTIRGHRGANHGGSQLIPSINQLRHRRRAENHDRFAVSRQGFGHRQQLAPRDHVDRTPPARDDAPDPLRQRCQSGQILQRPPPGFAVGPRQQRAVEHLDSARSAGPDKHLLDMSPAARPHI